ncbi:fimbrial protein [Haemophilus influenzae]|uniref:fimbrial protein n=1 Tax=Haemophilus influenzae TaxID=727 RepID=UPI0021596267|nr:fimbrial protein [Haemophilus influenzae]
MKKQLLSAALVAAFSSALAINANAADVTKGTINFEGQIVEQTCTVADNNSNQTISLGKAPRNAFTGKKSTANPTRFFIHLQNCTLAGAAGQNTATKVKAGFSSVENVDPTNEYTLKNKATSNIANGVHIQLFNENGTKAISPMKYSTKVETATVKHSLEDDADFKEIAQNATPDLIYIAKFYATSDNVGSGDVKSSVDFELVYE